MHITVPPSGSQKIAFVGETLVDGAVGVSNCEFTESNKTESKPADLKETEPKPNPCSTKPNYTKLNPTKPKRTKLNLATPH